MEKEGRYVEWKRKGLHDILQGPELVERGQNDRVLIKQGTHVPRNTTASLTIVHYTSPHLSLSPVLNHLPRNHT